MPCNAVEEDDDEEAPPAAPDDIVVDVNDDEEVDDEADAGNGDVHRPRSLAISWTVNAPAKSLLLLLMLMRAPMHLPDMCDDDDG